MMKPMSKRVQSAMDKAAEAGGSLSQQIARAEALLRTPAQTADLLAAIKKYEADQRPILKPGQARRFRSKIARRNAFTDLLAMSHVEGRS